MSNWESTGKIIKDTFAMAKKDKTLYAPPILNLVVGIVLFIIAIFVLLAGQTPDGVAPQAILIAVLLIKPSGLLGGSTQEKV